MKAKHNGNSTFESVINNKGMHSDKTLALTPSFPLMRYAQVQYIIMKSKQTKVCTS